MRLQAMPSPSLRPLHVVLHKSHTHIYTVFYLTVLQTHTCTLCGTSSSVEVGGSKAGMWMLSNRVIDMSIVPSLADDTPSNRPILVISWPCREWGRNQFQETTSFTIHMQYRCWSSIRLSESLELYSYQAIMQLQITDHGQVDYEMSFVQFMLK